MLFVSFKFDDLSTVSVKLTESANLWTGVVSFDEIVFDVVDGKFVTFFGD